MPQPRIVEIPDNFSIFSIAFSGDGKHLFAECTFEAVNIWSLVVFYWPEIGAGLVAVAAITSMVLLLRVRARPRRKGHHYCRRCNYEIDPASALCPECGSAISPRSSVAGRGTLGRLIPLVVLLCCVVLPYLAMWLCRLPREGRAQEWFDWSSEGLFRWAQFHKSKWLIAKPGKHRRVVDIDVPSGRVTRTLFNPGGYWELPLTPGPDGHSLLFTDRRGRLVLIDEESGRVLRALDRPDGKSGVGSKWESGWHRVAGFSDDGRAAYVSFFDEQRKSTLLIRWDLKTGSHREVLRIEGGAGSLLTVERRFFMVPGTSERRIVEVPMYGDNIRYGEQNELLVRDCARAGCPVVQRISAPFWTQCGVHFSRDGTKFLRKLWDSAWSEWDLTTGTMTQEGRAPGFEGTLQDPLDLDDARHRLLVGSTDAFELMTNVDGTWRSGTTYSLPKGSLPEDGFTMSPAGDCFAVSVFPGASGKYAVVIYDIAKAHP